MSVLAFAPTINKPGRKDATRAFVPEARKFVHLHGGDLVYVTNSNTMDVSVAMRDTVFRNLETDHAGIPREPMDCVAFFCHGYKTGLQFGFTKLHTPKLAAALVKITNHVALYACDAARDDDAQRADDLEEFGGAGGFAHMLAEEMVALAPNRYIWVDAHTTAAHTTHNPHVRRFETDVAGDVQGQYLVHPDSPRWATWRKLLRTDFRFEFPLLTRTEIQMRLDEEMQRV